MPGLPNTETPLADIKSLSARRDAVFMHLKNTRKVEVLVFPNGKQIVQAYTQFHGENPRRLTFGT